MTIPADYTRAHRPQPGIPAGSRLIYTVAVCLALSTPALADSVKLGGFWIQDVTVDSITGGQLLYYSSIGSEFSRPVAELRGLKLSAYPDMATAQDAMDAGDHAAAVQKLLGVLDNAREPWLRQWVLFQLVKAYDGAGDPARAVDYYLRLALRQVPAAYLESPPIDSVQNAEKRARQAVYDQLVAAEGLVSPGAGVEGVAALRNAVGDLEPEVEPGTSTSSGGVPEAAPDPVIELVVEPEPAAVDPIDTGGGRGSSGRVVLSKWLTASDQATRFLINGQYSETLSEVDKLLARGATGKLAMRLYQRGVAQMALAKAADNQELYLDAGLSFMGVVTNFPTSSYAGPSMIEAGAVHMAIGRPDIARDLLDRASGLIDEEEEPGYATRLEELRGRLQ